MKIQSVFDASFSVYGKVLTGFDVKDLLDKLVKTTEKPDNAVIYEPTDKGLESLPVAKEIADNIYGGMPVQIGYCNGNNTKLNCVEYHRDSEINIPADDVVFLLASVQKIKNNTLNTKEVEAFYAPAGTVVQLYETTGHYAPCNGVNDKKDGCTKNGFRVVVVLPKGTNTDKPAIKVKNDEDKLLWARNKWLIAHPDSSEAKVGAVAGLIGENITL